MMHFLSLQIQRIWNSEKSKEFITKLPLCFGYLAATQAKRLIHAAVVKLLSDDRRNYRVAACRVRLRVNTCWNNNGVPVMLLLLKRPGTSLYTMSCRVLSDLDEWVNCRIFIKLFNSQKNTTWAPALHRITFGFKFHESSLWHLVTHTAALPFSYWQIKLPTGGKWYPCLFGGRYI